MRFPNLIIVISACILSASCWISPKKTPSRYKNLTTVDADTYNVHKQKILSNVRFMANERISPFYSLGNDDSTEIYVDTVLYNSEISKVAFFIITQNQEKASDNYGYYSAYCLISNIEDSNFVNIRWLRYYSISRYESLETTSERIREMHFVEFKNRKKSGLKYNLDDIRFWDGPVWHK